MPSLGSVFGSLRQRTVLRTGKDPIKNFRTYEISKEFYHMIEGVEWPPHLRDQALRVASSVVLNVAEGAGLPSKKQKARHYHIAMGSLREVQAALEINRIADTAKIEAAA